MQPSDLPRSALRWLAATTFSVLAMIACENATAPATAEAGAIPAHAEPELVAAAALRDAGVALGNDAATPAPPKVSPLLRHPRRVVVEVAYADRAEPYDGILHAPFIDTWEITRTNLARLFGDDVTISVPTSREAMDRVVGAPQGTATAAQIVDFATKHRIAPPDDQVGFYVLFVDATFTDATGERPDVLAANIGDTGVLGVFKPSVTAAVAEHGSGAFLGAFSADFGRFVEQSTLVHELGHAVGLVGRRLDLTTPHKDEDHGAHCNSEACVMNWALENGPALFDFAMKAILQRSLILFGDECLADVDAVRR